jgi:hypothetical protein
MTVDLIDDMNLVARKKVESAFNAASVRAFTSTA